MSINPAAATTVGHIVRFPHMVFDDRRLTINQITITVSIFRESVENILDKEFGMTKRSTRLLPPDTWLKRNSCSHH